VGPPASVLGIVPLFPNYPKSTITATSPANGTIGIYAEALAGLRFLILSTNAAERS
jgi:hypothetical protein